MVYDPPDDFTPGPNEYRAASGPVIVTCTATGPGTGSVSYQWSSTCRDCPFQSSTSSSITQAAVHSGDNGTHTCVATRDDGSTARASIDFNVVGGSVFCIEICMLNVLIKHILSLIYSQLQNVISPPPLYLSRCWCASLSRHAKWQSSLKWSCCF